MKNIFLILFIPLALTGISQNHQLDIKIDNLINPEVYLADFYGDKNNILDTVSADTSGKLSFELPPSYPVGMYRVFLDKNIFFDIIYNNEDINIETDLNFLYDSLKVITSLENQIYYDYLRTRHNYRRKFDLLAPINDYYPPEDTFFHVARAQYISVQAEMMVYIDDLIKQYPESWSVKILKLQKPLFYDPSMDEVSRREFTKEHYFDNYDFTDVGLIRSNVYTTAAIEYMSIYSNPNFTQEQLESEFIKAVDKVMYEAMDNGLVYEFIVEYLVGGFERYHFEKVLDYIAENYTPEQCENEERKSDLQTRLTKYAELSIGKQAPGFVIPDANGVEIKLDKIKSKYTLLVFWASWCPHCNEMLPEIQNIYESSINPKNMEIIAISIDNDNAEWQSALSQGNYTWKNVSELKGWDSQVAIDYNIYATPTMFLLDKDKNILSKPITFEEMKQALMKENIIK